MEKKTDTPRTRNREWGFFGTCASNGHADPEAAWDEAMAALTDPKGLCIPKTRTRWDIDSCGRTPQTLPLIALASRNMHLGRNAF